MMTLILIAGICSADGCNYINASKRFDIKSNSECVHIANSANRQNEINKKEPRFFCVDPIIYKGLIVDEL